MFKPVRGRRNMKRIVQAAGLVMLIGVTVLLSTGCDVTLPARAEQTVRDLLVEKHESPDAATLRREVQLLNLLHGLELSEAKMRAVIRNAEEAQRIHEELSENRRKMEAEAVDVLSQFKAALLRNGSISDGLKREWHSLHTSGDALLSNAERDLSRVAGAVEATLAEHQLYALGQYTPCVVPPEGDLRIGQAGGGTAAEAVLVRVRDTPERAFDRQKDRLVSTILRRLGGRLPKGERWNVEAAHTVRSILNQARDLSDVEFELKKEALGQQLVALAELPEPNITTQIKRHLLDPHIIPLLEQRLR
jgi:hypothetical protein